MASLLEAAGPLSLLGAQCIYFAQPFVKGASLDQHLLALSNLLESKEETVAFINYLREAQPS